MTRILAVLLGLALGASVAHAQVTNSQTTNAAGTIATGNTFQQIYAAVGTPPAIRRSMTVQNNNASDSCWVFIGATASATKATSILLTSGQAYTRYFPYVPSDAVQITCANTSDTFYADTQ